MPNIRSYDAGTDIGLRPDDRAMESTAGAGRRISALHNQVAENQNQFGRQVQSAINDAGEVAVKHIEASQISRLAADSASVLANLDREWGDTIGKADPNDPTTATKFREDRLEPVLEKLSGDFLSEGARRFADAQVRRIREHFVTKTAGEMSARAGEAVKVNLVQLTNQLSSAAMMDPSSVRTTLGMLEHSINEMVDASPTMDGLTKASVKSSVLLDAQRTIVKAAAAGAVSNNPEAGLAEFSKPEYSKYLGGAELKSLEQQARAVQRAERADVTLRRQERERAIEEASDRREGEYIERLYSGDPKKVAEVSAKAIASDWTMTRSARERMIGIVERATEPEAPARVSNATAVELIRRIRAPIGDPERVDSLNAVYDALQKGQLNKSDFKFVTDEFKNIRTPGGEAIGRRQKEFIDGVKGFITGSNPLLDKMDPVGEKRLYEFTVDLQRKVEEYRRAGKDPYLLFDPRAPDYMGGPAALAPYQTSLQESITNISRSMKERPPVPSPVNPGPSIPPPDNRPPGLYDTPQGQMRWTGTGVRPEGSRPAARDLPASLRGIADLDYSPSRKQYRDRTTRKVYDAEGAEIEPTKVSTPAEAEKLAPGTRYQTPDGKVYVR